MQRILEKAALALALAAAIPALACTGNVTIGEGASAVTTSVPNKEVAGRCFNDLIVDTVAEGAAWDSEHEFVKAVEKLADRWQDRRLISRRQEQELVQAAKRSEVGKTVTVRVIGFNDFHGNLQSPGTF